MKELVRLGSFLLSEIENVLQRSFSNPGERVAFVSEIFLGVPYLGNTLSSEDFEKEVLVINFEGMDCMTFIEYVEALRVSFSFEDFKEKLRKVRYRNGVVSYSERKHFFTDWIYWNDGLIEITHTLKEGYLRLIKKRLNLRIDGTYVLPGIEPVDREIAYLPAEDVDNVVMERLSTGDYVGFYTSEAGLDCSHTGIILKKGKDTYLRHASSKNGKVMDEDFLDYVRKKEGIIVLRPV